jgi:hypothetical protein
MREVTLLQALVTTTKYDVALAIFGTVKALASVPTGWL